VGDQPDHSEINAETVETLVDNVREMIKAEDAREQGFNVRAGGLAGFLGLTVSAAIAVAKVGLDTPLSCVATVCAAISLAFATLVGLDSLSALPARQPRNRARPARSSAV
jgi:hypothetical protein